MSLSIFTRGKSPSQAEYCRVCPVGDASDRWAQLLNLSHTEVSLLIAAPLEVGTVVRIVLPRTERMLKARIVHIDEEGPGCYLVEADVVKQITDEEIDELIKMSRDF